MIRVKNLFGRFTKRLRFLRLFKYKIAFMFLLKYEGLRGIVVITATNKQCEMGVRQKKQWFSVSL